MADEQAELPWRPARLSRDASSGRMPAGLEDAQANVHHRRADRKHRDWSKDPEARAPVYGNRRRCGDDAAAA